MRTINLKVNGKDVSVEIEEGLRLIDLLRDKLHLVGTKEGCGEGECGSCSIIMDGELINSCLVTAMQAEGKEILTIEGMQNGEQLHPIQKAYLDAGAVQCGFCIPGMVLATKVILDKNEEPSEEEIRKGLAGNLCRCTGYTKIVDAVQIASRYIKEEEK
ncbi:(2Fe-2S)-binding protein [Clostridium cylindrosporum]|uniref:Glyceraldehyde dehydrogenase small chain CutC n=1 Tax=Clostridium cylindrosporum DSM 605 TaxID=1121307 RepID=A0A0J8DCW0_CLOCY|nr:(2Fe-2S)-binding protein [Clostridium cylindrosporum]KMT22088.1 glyceraldehyde dehydrogenase small chain CutC [Clostridium cylindrosporum DSM 605]